MAALRSWISHRQGEASDVVMDVVLVVCLTSFQLLLAIQATNQIRYEELAESVRNVYWLHHRAIYDGVSSNIGWYGTLLLFYQGFGFGLHHAKIVRVVLYAIGLLCLASLLRKYLGRPTRWIPLLTYGLSPTLLYFNTLQTAMGIDLSWAPICFFLIDAIDFEKQRPSFLLHAAAAGLLMVGCMSYPTMLFYLPAVCVFYVYKLWHYRKSQGLEKAHVLRHAFVALGAFLLPLIGGVLWLEDKRQLLFDPVTKSGIFRGGGQLELSWGNFLLNLSGSFHDLFVRGSSYYFELHTVEFSTPYAWVSVGLLALVVTGIAVTNRKYRLPLLLMAVLLASGIVGSNFSRDASLHPGLRRNTAILVVVHVFVAIAWHFVSHADRRYWKSKCLCGLITLPILVHHVMAYPVNSRHIGDLSVFRYGNVFADGETPAQSLAILVEKVRKNDLVLPPRISAGEYQFARYAESYAAITGYCLWNDIACHDVYGYDPRTRRYIKLGLSLWQRYYWPH